VIRKIAQQGRGIPALYEVEFRAGGSLLIEVAAIEYFGQEANQIKLSMEALLELRISVKRDSASAKSRTVVSLNRGQPVGVDSRLPC
jgi:hypothetical protein